MTLNIKIIKGKENLGNFRRIPFENLLQVIKFMKKDFDPKACLCKMKLLEEREGNHIFSEYNNAPDSIINTRKGDKNFILNIQENNKCYCDSSKYKLINIIQDNEQNIKNLKYENGRLQDEIKDLNVKNQDLQKKVKTNEQLLGEFIEMKKNVEDNNKNEMLKLEKDYQQKLDELNNQNKNEKEKNLQQINNLQNEHEKEIQNKNNEIDKLKEDNKKTKKEKEQKLKEINTLNDKYKEEIEKLNKEKENLKKEGEILGSVDPGKLKELKKLGIINNIEIKSNVFEIDPENRVKLNDNGPKNVIFENFYDMIVNIKSIKDIDKGWELKMNEKGLKNYIDFRKKN